MINIIKKKTSKKRQKFWIKWVVSTKMKNKKKMASFFKQKPFCMTVTIIYPFDRMCFLVSSFRLLFSGYFSLLTKTRSSHRMYSVREGVLTNFVKFTGKHLCQSLFFNKLATLLKKRLWHRCFPVNFVKFLRKHFLQPLGNF